MGNLLLGHIYRALITLPLSKENDYTNFYNKVYFKIVESPFSSE